MSVAIETRPFDAASYLDSDEAIAEFLTAVLETGDASFIADAGGTIGPNRFGVNPLRR